MEEKLISQVIELWGIERESAIRNLERCELRCPNCDEITVMIFENPKNHSRTESCILCEYGENR